jgi:hypothetical protein
MCCAAVIGSKTSSGCATTRHVNALGADLIPDPTTAGDFCRRFRESDVVALMECFNAVRPRLWRGGGRDLLGSVTYIDVDGTIAPTYGEKKEGWTFRTKASGLRAAHRVAVDYEGSVHRESAGDRAEPHGCGSMD